VLDMVRWEGSCGILHNPHMLFHITRTAGTRGVEGSLHFCFPSLLFPLY